MRRSSAAGRAAFTTSPRRGPPWRRDGDLVIPTAATGPDPTPNRQRDRQHRPPGPCGVGPAPPIRAIPTAFQVRASTPSRCVNGPGLYSYARRLHCSDPRPSYSDPARKPSPLPRAAVQRRRNPENCRPPSFPSIASPFGSTLSSPGSSVSPCFQANRGAPDPQCLYPVPVAVCPPPRPQGSAPWRGQRMCAAASWTEAPLLPQGTRTPSPPPPHGGPGSRGGAPPPGTAHIAIKNIGAMKAAKGITPVSVGSRPQAPLRAPHGCRSFPCFFFNLSRIRIGSVCEV